MFTYYRYIGVDEVYKPIVFLHSNAVLEPWISGFYLLELGNKPRECTDHPQSYHNQTDHKSGTWTQDT